MTLFALAFLACSQRPAILAPPTENVRTEMFLLELGGVPIAVEERRTGFFTGEPTVWRQRTYAWQLGGEDVQARAVTRAMQVETGETVAYARQLNEQPIQSWSGFAWLPEVAAAADNLPVGWVRVIMPDSLEVEEVEVTRTGTEWTWQASGAQVVLNNTADGPTATWGGLSLRPIPEKIALERVDPVALLRRPSSAFETARQAYRAVFQVDGVEVEVRVPLWAELPAAEPIAVSPADEHWQGIPTAQPAEVHGFAQTLIGDASSRRDAVHRLVLGVQKTLVIAPTPGTPDALQALQSGRGDCNEHAELFVSLAVSAGIPARSVSGAVYTSGGPWGPGLDLHAWAEVWMADQWVPVDPAFGQAIADATHLPLARQRRIEQSLGPWMNTKISLTQVY